MNCSPSDPPSPQGLWWSALSTATLPCSHGTLHLLGLVGFHFWNLILFFKNLLWPEAVDRKGEKSLCIQSEPVPWGQLFQSFSQFPGSLMIDELEKILELWRLCHLKHYTVTVNICYYFMIWLSSLRYGPGSVRFKPVWDQLTWSHLEK